VSRTAQANSSPSVAYVQTLPPDTYIIDVRSEVDCLKSSLADAHCLSVEMLLPTPSRLANFSGLLWQLGTVGLTGEEHVLIVGQSTLRKDFIGGVLYLAGQRKISILEPSIADSSSTPKAWVFDAGRSCMMK